MTVKDAYDYAKLFLQGNGVDEYEFKSLCVVCHLAGISNSQYQTHLDDEIITSRLAKMLWDIKSGVPLQYVLGKWDFYESEFYVGKGVLIPRPETEELVDLAINYAKKYTNPVIFDLCSGSGCIGISVAKKVPSSTVYCVEKSEDAFYYLQKNANGINNIKLINDDICNDIDLPKADIIISNPPYIKSADIKDLQAEVQNEPLMALDGGDDGFFFYRVINDKWSEKLSKNGVLLLEIGNEQGKDIVDVLSSFSNVEVKKDIYGNDRMVVANNIVGD